LSGPGARALGTSAAGSSALRRALAPSYSDLLFIAMVVWLFMLGEDAWSRLLVDGDTGWHIRVGEHILDGKGIPRTDFFSLTKFGEQWFAWEWLADVVYAWLHRVSGLKGVLILSGVQIALFAVLLARFMLWRGANAMVAVGVTLLAAGAGSLHYLARPHLYTLALLPAALWALERDRGRRDGRIWLMVPAAAVWTNLHGGVFAFLACLGLAVGGEALERRWDLVRRWLLLLAGCSAATLVNPYGAGLHLHVAAYMRSDWIRDAVDEFQSPKFRSENLLQYEALLVAGLMASASVAWRRWRAGGVESPFRWTHALWILFWAHQSLASVRHVTVFVTVAAPVVAVEATAILDRLAGSASARSVAGILRSMVADMGAAFRWTSAWPALFVAALAAFDLGSRWPDDFPTLRFPVKMVADHAGLIRGRRVLTTDEWGDYLLYRFHPGQRVYFDGRTDFYGPSVGKDYVRLTGGGHGWDAILDRHGFEAALLPLDLPLTSLLKCRPGWSVAADDGKSLLFERVAGPVSPALQFSRHSPEGTIGAPPGPQDHSDRDSNTRRRQ
jgi:hypothetical protein